MQNHIMVQGQLDRYAHRVAYAYIRFTQGFFDHGIDTYDRRETRANTGLLPLVYNRVGVATAGLRAACKSHE